MISFFVGVPGSGKTYYAVDKIYNNFSTDKEAKKDKHIYDVCYTNINEFAFDKVTNVFSLDFDDFKIKLTTLHKLYKEKNSDDVLIDYCKENNIYNSYFVIDEAHNFFSVKDTVLVWWLSYHRHLYHEIILITQNLALIDSKYKSFSEFFYRATPTSLTLFKTHFKYNQYCDSRMSLKSKTSTFKLKKNKKVFELYHSGDSIKTSNIILKFLLFSLVLLIFLFIYFYFVVLNKDFPILDNNVSSSVPITNSSDLVSSPDSFSASALSPINDSSINLNSENYNFNSNNYQNLKYFSLSCNLSYCYNSDISIPTPLLNYFIKSSEIKLFYIQDVNKHYSKLYLYTLDEFYQFLLSSNSKKGSDNVKNINGVHNIVPNFMGKQ
ncbi:MAG: Zot protein [Patescibacteria group bacterium]|nr:Zot protein [Patescibacteria group bacterium]